MVKATWNVKSKAVQYIWLARMDHLKELTDSNRAADQPCSSDASAAACTEVQKFNWTRVLYCIVDWICLIALQ